MPPHLRPQLRAAIYVRVSSDDQTRGYGPAIQLDETLKAAQEDGCLVRPEHIIDDSVSGSHDHRPGWQHLLEIARRREIDVVYFWKLDRMMRDEYYFYVNERELKALDVQLRFATQNLEDPFNRAIQVAVAAEERRKILERTYGGRIRALRDGKWVAPIPYGYVLDKATGRLKVNKHEANRVRMLFEALVRDRLTLTSLGRYAKAHGIPTRNDHRRKLKRKSGYGFWSKGSLGRLLTREYYATGVAWFHKYQQSDRRYDIRDLRPKDQWIRVSVPHFISRHLFDKAQRQLRRNSQYAWGTPKYSYLFAGMLRCGVCDRKLTACHKPKRKHGHYYRGDSWADERCQSCRYYLEANLDGPIWQAILDVLRQPSKLLAILEEYRSQTSQAQDLHKEQQELLAFKADLEKKEQRIIDLELDGFYSRQVLEAKKRGINRERQAVAERELDLRRRALLDQERISAVAAAGQLYEKIRASLEIGHYEVRQRVYAALIDKIILRGDHAQVWLNLPSDLRMAAVASAVEAEAPEPRIPLTQGDEHPAGADPDQRRRTSCMERDSAGPSHDQHDEKEQVTYHVLLTVNLQG